LLLLLPLPLLLLMAITLFMLISWSVIVTAGASTGQNSFNKGIMMLLCFCGEQN